MISSLKELMKKVYAADLQKKQFEVKQKDMEFKLLASRINPHFFFNALETIRAKARTNQISELEEIVKSLGRIMRKSLENKKEQVSVQSEVEFTLHYLEIQKYRFEEKLEYSITMNDIIKEMNIIPHLFQPIVENAIVHGIEQKIGGGTILLSGSRVRDTLIFTIEDNGLGIRKDKLDLIKNALADSDGTWERAERKSIYGKGPHGTGLLNVHQRIRLYYGRPYGIRVASKEGEGTIVSLQLPAPGSRSNV
jgi:two-component system sensor histidine kinase YesM